MPFLGGGGAWRASNLLMCLKFQESSSNVGHAAIKLATMFSMTLILVTVVRQKFKSPHPPTESVSAHLCYRVPRIFQINGISFAVVVTLLKE